MSTIVLKGGEVLDGGGPRARLHRLGLLAPGLAQVGVEVDEAGGHHAAGGVEDDVGVEVSADDGDGAVAHNDVGAPPAAAVEHLAAFQDDRAHSSTPDPSSR